MSTPIPIMLLGKIPSHMKLVSEIVRPEYEIIQTASSVDDAISVLPSLLSSSDASQKIKVVIMGGGFSPADFEKVQTEVPEAKSVPWMRPNVAPSAGSGPPQVPSAEMVAGRARKCLDEHAGELREGRGQGEVWKF